MQQGLMQFRDRLQRLSAEVPNLLCEMADREGQYVVKRAKEICTKENIGNTGQYREGFHSDPPQYDGRHISVRVYNGVDYAEYLEYGFRSHWVPGEWEGNTFVYMPGYTDGGMYVGPKGGYVRGHYVFHRALAMQKQSYERRMRHALSQKIAEKLR